MSWFFLDATARAAWNAATSQTAQLEALAATFTTGPQIRYYTSAGTHLGTATHSGFDAIDTGTTPYSLTLGALAAWSPINTWTAAYAVLAVPSGADILRADVALGAAVNASARVNMDDDAGAAGMRFNASGALPFSDVPAWVQSLTPLTWTELTTTTPFKTWALANTVPSTGYRSTGDPFGSVLDDYCDFVQDEPNRMFYLHGGGHFGSSVNAVYGFDPEALQWSIPVAPTPPSKYPPGYVEANSRVIYPSGLELEYFGSAADLTDPADAAYILPERQRRASHTYAALGFWNGRVLCHFNYFGAANVGSGLWESVVPISPYASQLLANGWANNGTAPFQPNTACAVDWGTGSQYVWTGGGDIGDNLRPGVYKINPTTQVVEAKWGNNGIGLQMVSTATHAYAIADNIAAGLYTNLMRVEFSTGTRDWIGLTGTVISAPSGTDMETVPSCTDGTYAYLWHYNADRYGLFRIRLSDGLTDRVALGGSGMPQPRFRYRLMYVAEWNVVMVAPNKDAKWWAVKLA